MAVCHGLVIDKLLLYRHQYGYLLTCVDPCGYNADKPFCCARKEAVVRSSRWPLAQIDRHSIHALSNAHLTNTVVDVGHHQAFQQRRDLTVEPCHVSNIRESFRPVDVLAAAARTAVVARRRINHGPLHFEPPASSSTAVLEQRSPCDRSICSSCAVKQPRCKAATLQDPLPGR